MEQEVYAPVPLCRLCNVEHADPNCKRACAECYMQVRDYIKAHIIAPADAIYFLCERCANVELEKWRDQASDQLPRRFGTNYEVMLIVSAIYYELEKDAKAEQNRIRDAGGIRYLCLQCESPLR